MKYTTQHLTEQTLMHIQPNGSAYTRSFETGVSQARCTPAALSAWILIELHLARVVQAEPQVPLQRCFPRPW